MRIGLVTLLLLSITAACGPAHVTVVSAPPPARPVARHVWDTNGWQKLGEQTVDFGRRLDKDTIIVGRYEGRFSKLTMVVDDSDLELLDFAVTFGPRGETWRPAGVGHYFRENQRTRVIDLPGDDRIIQKIDLKYRNLPGGGRARVEIWGYKSAPVVVAPPPPPPPRPVVRKATWDNRGWVKLGEQTVDHGRRADKDTIPVGRYEGRFSKLTMVVEDDDLELLDFAVTFGPRGEVWRPAGVGHYFREDQRTRVIDLPGDDRIIQKIDLTYRNLPGGGRARVEVWGFKTTGTAPPPPPVRRPPVIRKATWDNKGWVKLGEQTVDHGRRADKDTIVVGKYEGRFSKLTMVVEDDDLELLDFAVTFGPRGEVWRPAGVGHYFREDQRTRVIDLPGDDRIIQKIDLTYRNLPGGGRARVELWAFKTTGAPPPPVRRPPVIRKAAWDNKGWVKLGEQTVDHGRKADKDTIVVGKYEGRFSKLTMVVEDDDLELLDFAVTFGPRGEVWRPAGVGHYFREDQRTRVIDLPGDDRIIQKIDLTYRNLPGGGRARVELWAFKTTGAPPARPVIRKAAWDNKGWVKLGEQTVDHGRRADKDTIVVGKYEGRFSKLTMVVDDDDLELLDFAVTFGPRGEVWRPASVGHYFRENQRTRVIDLPGDTRIIQKIDLKYRNLPGGGKARVEIWGFKK